VQWHSGVFCPEDCGANRERLTADFLNPILMGQFPFEIFLAWLGRFSLSRPTPRPLLFSLPPFLLLLRTLEKEFGWAKGSVDLLSPLEFARRVLSIDIRTLHIVCLKISKQNPGELSAKLNPLFGSLGASPIIPRD
jgi:hypothetical protein